jgi:hypothetical protein
LKTCHVNIPVIQILTDHIAQKKILTDPGFLATRLLVEALDSHGARHAHTSLETCAFRDDDEVHPVLPIWRHTSPGLCLRLAVGERHDMQVNMHVGHGHHSSGCPFLLPAVMMPHTRGQLADGMVVIDRRMIALGRKKNARKADACVGETT